MRQVSSESLGADLSVGPPATRLPDDHPDVAVMAELGTYEGLVDARDVEALRGLAARNPDSPLVWALLARTELDGVASDPEAVALDAVTAYAYARAGYHRGLDALRRSGWRGQGYIPVSHIPNRGFLAALIALGDSARLIGETEEADRIAQFVEQSDPEALAFLARGVVAGPAGTEEQE